MENQLIRLGLDIDTPLRLSSSTLSVKCPMCRTLTTARADRSRERTLRTNYPSTYAERSVDAAQPNAVEDGETEVLTIYIGNGHRLVRTEDESSNKHEWLFFVRPSRTDLIEEVQVFLHPTFRNHKVIVQWAPYEIRRVGWGTFTVYANVILKPGFRWESDEAEDTEDGGARGMLPLEWQLDFEGRGSQGRRRLRVRREKGDDGEEERERERVRRGWERQRAGDPDYVPPDSPPAEAVRNG